MLTVHIVNFNTREDLRACLASLHAYAPTREAMRIVVVDNASGDGSADMVASDFPDVTLVRNTTNRGFTGGNNDAIAAARGTLSTTHAGDTALLLNPDTVVPAGALDALLAFLRERPRAGVVGPRLVYGDGTPQSSRRRFPTLATGLFESTWLRGIAPRRVLARYRAEDLPDDAPAEVDWVVGAAMLTRWEVIDAVGGLDEASFFMYSEEIDWCRRVKAAGWSVWWTPAAKITHFEARSSDQVSERRLILFNTSRARYFSKHHGALAGGIVRAAALLGFAVELMIEAAKGVLGSKRALRAQRVRAYAAALRSGLR
ncbi:MAG: glycosyltransferase family 2 protein [Thermoflexales bacterium]|nr:glycosyltransferase family 2 protein [Thermoflexales bacterium]